MWNVQNRDVVAVKKTVILCYFRGESLKLRHCVNYVWPNEQYSIDLSLNALSLLLNSKLILVYEIWYDMR